MKAAFFALLATLVVSPALAQQDAVVELGFSNPALYPAQWTLVLHQDGSGHFSAQGGSRPADHQETMFPGKMDRDVRLSPEFTSRIFQAVSKNGGHLASNLGVVELTIALHYVYDFGPHPKGPDRLLFDVDDGGRRLSCSSSGRTAPVPRRL